MSAGGIWRKRLLAICVGTFIAVLLAECTLRIAGVSYPSFRRSDAILGFRLRANMDGIYTAEGHAHVHINSAGWRDREHELTKPIDTLRIAVLGDSYAEALQVERDDAFWAVLESELEKNGGAGRGRHVELLNFGVSGYGTAQELLVLQNFVWKYDPDIVVLAFLTGNDIHNNSKALDPQKMRPYYSIRKGSLTLDNSFRDLPEYRFRSGTRFRIERWFKDRSRLVQVVHRLLSSSQGTTDSCTESGLDAAVYGEPAAGSEWAAAWTVTRALLAEMKAETQRHNALFAVVGLTNGIQVNPDPTIRSDFVKNCAEVTQLDYPNKRIAGFARDIQFPYLDLVGPFRARAESKQEYLHGFGETLGTGHWNVAGHRFAGELLAGWVRELLRGTSSSSQPR